MSNKHMIQIMILSVAFILVLLSMNHLGSKGLSEGLKIILGLQSPTVRPHGASMAPVPLMGEVLTPKGEKLDEENPAPSKISPVDKLRPKF